MTAHRDADGTHWPEVAWTGLDVATLTCTCGAVETELLALSHPLAYEAAAAQLVAQHRFDVDRDRRSAVELLSLE